MNDDRTLSGARQIVQLAERLSRISEITKLNRGEEKEAWTIAHAFSDMEESMFALTQSYFPKLLAEKMPVSDLVILLQEIGEELRHIVYHLSDMRYYQYIWPDREDMSTENEEA